MTTDDKPQCRGTRKDGTPCRLTFGISESGFCQSHDPDPAVQERVRAIRSAGGKARRGTGKPQTANRAATPLLPDDVPPIPKTLEDAVKYFAWTVNAMATGRLDARSGHEISYALNGFKGALEKRDLEREIERLSALVKELQAPRPRLA